MTAIDLFEQINAAVLDLQGATQQTFERPLRKLGQLLDHPDLASLNESLTAGVNLDEFLRASGQTGGSLIGSKKLLWPDEPREDLGMRLLLVRHVAGDPERAFAISHDYFYSAGNITNGLRSMTGQLIIPFIRDYKEYVQANGETRTRLVRPKSKEVFIVHGHDDGARESVARFIEKIGLRAIILHEQVNRGRTIIEKVEAQEDVGFAVVLLTADDEGRTKGTGELESRPRQNVLLELGYFIGRLGRENVCTLKKGELAIPSDFAGVVWTSMSDGSGWKVELAKELQAAGYAIDWNQIMHG
ncbi:MAG: nucleotide-binding protein [Lysobacteraceae bacterium]